MRTDLIGVETRAGLTEQDIFRMKPGDKFVLKAAKPGSNLKKFCHLRYMRDGAMVRIELVEPGIILISL
jgi:hypothetical protein